MEQKFEAFNILSALRAMNPLIGDLEALRKNFISFIIPKFAESAELILKGDEDALPSESLKLLPHVNENKLHFSSSVGKLTVYRTSPEFTEVEVLRLDSLFETCAPVFSAALDLRNAYKQIESQKKILAYTAHDLRTPLTSLILLIGFLKRKFSAKSEAPAIEYLNSMNFSATYMELLIGSVSTYLRSDEIGIVVERAECGPNAIVNEALMICEPFLLRKAIRINRNSECAGTVFCDSKRIVEILVNLIINSVKHSAPAGEILIKLEALDSSLSFTVEDFGPGIAEADIPKIFEPYWQRSGHGSGGEGLGLAAVKALVDAHGGVISVKSSPGKGLKFTFTLPEYKTQVQTTRHSSHSNYSSAALDS